jgi:nucleoside phosphorylase
VQKCNVLKIILENESLVGSVVISVELGREDHDSIPVTVIGRGLKPLDVRTDPRTKFNWR